MGDSPKKPESLTVWDGRQSMFDSPVIIIYHPNILGMERL